MCHSSSSVLVLNRTSPSLLHTFVACSTQLSIAIQHAGNSFLHQHIPRKRLRASVLVKYNQYNGGKRHSLGRTIKVCSSDGGEKSPSPWKVLLNLTFNGF